MELLCDSVVHYFDNAPLVLANAGLNVMTN